MWYKTYPKKFAALLGLAALGLTGCGERSEKPVEDAAAARDGLQIGEFVPREIGLPLEEKPWITDVTIVDLDQDGLLDVLVCDGKLNRVSWIRQSPVGVYREALMGEAIQGPVKASAADIDSDGDLDVLVAGMGVVLPNNAKTGTVTLLENDGTQVFKNIVLLEDTFRVTDVQAGDLDGDGDLDLSVGQFGYAEGEVRWMENRGGGVFESHSLIDLSGTVRAPIADFDRDGDLDIAALITQEWEEIHIFENKGPGVLRGRAVYGSTNEDYGSSGMDVGDVDGDGDLDLVFTNGDGFDYSTPGVRPWHGVQWLENDGSASFTFHRIGAFAGAYGPRIADVDGDGDQDVLLVSGFNDWSRPDLVTVVCFENDGQQNFTERPLARAPTNLVALDTADMDGDGEIELVTGGFNVFPPWDRMSRVWLWDRPNGKAASQ